MSWRMPAEGAPQERLWMAWPTSGYTLGDTPAEAEEARVTWAAVANAAAAFEPVSVVIHPRDSAIAPRYLDDAIELHVREIDDAWMRDTGPTFVIDDRIPGRLGAVDWTFNGWGGQEWASWEHDATLAGAIAGLAGAELIESTLVNEGGGIHVDGQGTVLATESVQLDPARNPGTSKAEVEAELSRTLGTTSTIWLPRGLTRDSDRFGTRGHVDIVATFAAAGVVLLHDQRDPGHPDYAVCEQLRAVLGTARDAHRLPLELVRLPAPDVLHDSEGFVDYSYVNHVLVNGGVIACAFDDARDADAVAILRDAYPGRTVITVDARPLFARGGGIHCITQQQPAV